MTISTFTFTCLIAATGLHLAGLFIVMRILRLHMTIFKAQETRLGLLEAQVHLLMTIAQLGDPDIALARLKLMADLPPAPFELAVKVFCNLLAMGWSEARRQEREPRH